MYKSLLVGLLCFVAFSEACQPPPCHWSDAKPIEDYFHKVANALIAADRKIQSVCQQQGSPMIKEDQQPKEYRLVYPNPDAELFDIKVRDRVLLVRAANCLGSVADVRVLPPYVDPRRAHYSVENFKLVITFQYKFEPGNGGGVCVPPDPSIITIPQGSGQDCVDCNYDGRGW